MKNKYILEQISPEMAEISEKLTQRVSEHMINLYKSLDALIMKYNYCELCHKNLPEMVDLPSSGWQYVVSKDNFKNLGGNSMKIEVEYYGLICPSCQVQVLIDKGPKCLLETFINVGN